jgi:hypothetical protein
MEEQMIDVECAKCKQMTREVDVPLDTKSVYRLKMLCLPCADEEERGCEIERMLKYGNG